MRFQVRVLGGTFLSSGILPNKVNFKAFAFMSISSDEINFLIQRYFCECGFDHSLYTFNTESSMDLSQMNGSQIPPGALITLLQKGLLYIQLEKEIQSQHNGQNGVNIQLTLLDAALREGTTLPPSQDKADQDNSDAVVYHFEQSNSITLTGHKKDALCCVWDNTGKYLATGSSDSTAIIWNVSNMDSISSCVIQHKSESDGVNQNQVLSLDWSPDSQCLVTGCSDGTVHLWNNNGEELHCVEIGANKLIHVVRFDPSGTNIIYGGRDSTIGIINAETGEIIKKIESKHNDILDANWKDEITYAAGCNDGYVLMFDPDVNDSKILELTGHSGAVNGVSWSPNGKYLASCSDDKTIRLWHKAGASIVLEGHTSQVYAVKWNSQNLCASASFDNTLRIWDPRNGSCLNVLKSHSMQIYGLSFSNDGEFLVSGSADQSIKVWRVSDGKLLCSFLGTQSIYDVQFDKQFNNIAVCCAGGNIIIVPASNLQLSNE